jgi:dimethylhistidine N-methyltransferase
MLNQIEEKRIKIKSLTTSNSFSSLNFNSGEDVIKGLTQNPKSLPPKYFYDDKGSEIFEQICDLPEYYPTRTEALILQNYAEEITNITGACELIELGSGSSTKTRLLLDAYQKISNKTYYVPIDVSGSILEASSFQLHQEYPSLHIKGLVGTYEEALNHLEPSHLPSRLIFFLGSSLGNFNPEECDHFFAQIDQVLEVGDYFLLGIDLHKSSEILEPAYNDSQGITADFNLNMLTHLNWKFDGNFDINLFSHKAIYNQIEKQIEMYLYCEKDCTVRLEKLNLEVNFLAGERILTEISRKFNLVEIKQNLQNQGLKTLKFWTDPQEQFALLLCQVQKK